MVTNSAPFAGVKWSVKLVPQNYDRFTHRFGYGHDIVYFNSELTDDALDFSMACELYEFWPIAIFEIEPGENRR